MLLLKAWLVVLAALAVVWFSIEFRPVPALQRYITQRIESSIAPATLSVGDLTFKLEAHLASIRVRLTDVSVKDTAGKEALHLPLAKADIPLWHLMDGALGLRRLEIDGAKIALRKEADGSLYFERMALGGNSDSQGKTMPEILAEWAGAVARLNIGDASFRHVNIAIREGEKISTHTIPLGSVKVHQKGERIQAVFGFDLTDPQGAGRLEAVFSYDVQGQNGEGKLNAKGVSIAWLKPFLPLSPYVRGLDLRFSANASVYVKGDSLSAMNLEVTEATGGFSDENVLPEPLPIAYLTLKLRGYQDGLTLDALTLKNADVSVLGKGKLLKENGRWISDFEAVAQGMPVERITDYWPKQLSADSRDWVKANLRAGSVPDASLALHYEQAESPEQGPSMTLDAKVKAENVTLTYLPKLPEVTGVNGVATFTAQGFDVNVSSGASLTGTKLNKAEISVADLSAHGIPMQVNLALLAPATDVAAFLGPGMLNAGKALKLDPETITGQAEGTIKLTFPLYSAEAPPGEKGIRYEKQASVTGLSQKGILGKWDIEGFNGMVGGDHTYLSLKGKTGLNGIPSTLDIRHEYKQDGTTTYRLIADVPASSLPEFGFDTPEGVAGTLSLDAVSTERAGRESTEASLGLDGAAIAIPRLGWKKPEGVPAHLTLQMERQVDMLLVHQFDFTSQGMDASGELSRNARTGALDYLKLTRFKYGKTDIAAAYRRGDTQDSLALAGSALDLEPFTSDDAKDGKNPLDQLRNLKLELDLNTLRFAKDRELRALKGHIDCLALCNNVALRSMTVNKKPFTFDIYRKDGRQVSMRSDDAGGVMKAFGVSDHVRGGTLDYKADFRDGEDHRQQGRLLVTDFSVVNGPVLTKLLSLASLTGLLDALTGSGISFKKMALFVSFVDGKLTITKGKAFGSSIGITGAGTIEPFYRRMAMEGTLVPAYSANKMIGQIPLVGDILIGKEGEGVFAANYSVKGDTADPSVTVNPLSLLAPGFLRNLFDMFDEDTSGEDEGWDAEAEPVSATSPAEH